jgi:hypothetical protein
MFKKYIKVVEKLLKCGKILYIYSMDSSSIWKSLLAAAPPPSPAAAPPPSAEMLAAKVAKREAKREANARLIEPPSEQQTPTEEKDLVKVYKDMYERQAKNAQAMKTQNLNAARLNAQQTAALAGYSPDMAQRAMFEQTAGAYKSNQDIENDLARFGLDVADKEYDVFKYMDERDYKRYLDAGYTYDPKTKQYTLIPKHVKEMEDDSSINNYIEEILSDTTGKYNEANKQWANNQKRQQQAKYSANETAWRTAEAITLASQVLNGTKDIKGLSDQEIKSILNSELGDSVKAKLMSANSGVPNYTNDDFSKVKEGELIFWNSELVRVGKKEGRTFHYTSLEKGGAGDFERNRTSEEKRDGNLKEVLSFKNLLGINPDPRNAASSFRNLFK